MLKKLFVAFSAFALCISPCVSMARRGGGADATSGPLSLPLLTTSQASSMLTFLGSFTVPSSGQNGFSYGGGALTVNGSTMYMSSLVYQPNGSGQLQGIGSFTIPTLSGTPVYNGTNGSISTSTIVGPNAPGTVAPITYTLTSAPAAGAVCATFNSLPPGIAASGGWFLDFSGGATDNEAVTSVGTCNGANSVGWATGLSTSYGASVSVYKWGPYPLFNTSGGGNQIITGSTVSGGNLYVTGGGQYDGNCNNQLGWASEVSASTIGPSWGAVNTLVNNQSPVTSISWSSGTVTVDSAGVPSGLAVGNTFPIAISGVSPSGYDGIFTATKTASGVATYSLASDPGTETALGTLEPTEAGRYFAGPIEPIPSVWQSTFGDVFETSGPGLSVDSCHTSSGPTFQEFSLANVSASQAAVPTKEALGYTYDFDPTNPNGYLQGRSLSGPFPLAENDVGANYYPATLVSAPTANATSVQINVATGAVTVTANLTSTTMDVTAVTSGTINNSGNLYDVSDSSGYNVIPSGSELYPAYQYTPGTVLGTGNYEISIGPTASVTGDTVTLSPSTYDSSDPWKIWFSDGESRIGTFSTSAGVATLTFSPALTGSGIGTAVHIAPMGDNYSSAYDGNYAGAFIVPNTRTLVTAWKHNDGPHQDKGSAASCSSNSSGNYSTPLAPDTKPYQSLRLYLYDLQDVENGANGSQYPYVASPYAFVDFPDSANLFPSTCVTLGNTYAMGSMYLDPSTDILYIATGSAPTSIYEYKVTPP